jgi:ribulose-5-phosphate 4-epimerase/fuculose-1-phosphate aldolase
MGAAFMFVTEEIAVRSPLAGSRAHFIHGEVYKKRLDVKAVVHSRCTT